MAEGFNAAGDSATGTAQRGHGGDDACLNCGTALIGDHCHRCGQSGQIHRTLSSVGHDLLHGAFHFEGEIWRTLVMLILHPGALTRRYIAGERTRFMSPLTLFLFAVFVLFAAIHLLGGQDSEPDLNASMDRVAVQQISERIDAAKAKRSIATTAAEKADLDTTIASLGQTRDGIDPAHGHHFQFTNLKTGWPRLDHGIARANADPSLAIYKLQMSAYKFSWALIPISVPFMALLFLWRRRYHLYDHTIFVIYSIDFMTLLAIVLSVAGAIGISNGIISAGFLLVPPLHIFRQLRGAYQLRRFSAVWRTIALCIFAGIALLLFFALLLAFGLMG